MHFTTLRRQPLYPERMATSLNNTAWLEWVSALMGGVSRQTHAATFPPDRYYCLLDELPVHLIPRQFVSSRVWRQGQPLDLYLNPACTLRSAEDLPDDTGVSNEIRSAFALQGTIAWVRDSQSQALLP